MRSGNIDFIDFNIWIFRILYLSDKTRVKNQGLYTSWDCRGPRDIGSKDDDESKAWHKDAGSPGPSLPAGTGSSPAQTTNTGKKKLFILGKPQKKFFS